MACLSFLTLLATGVMTILLPSRLKVTSLPGATPAAVRMCLGIVTWPFSVTSMFRFFRDGRNKK
jgi:hypothetical protein